MRQTFPQRPPMLSEGREDTARRIVGLLMMEHGHQELGLYQGEDGIWRHVWESVARGRRFGVTVFYAAPGECVAVDIDTEEPIARGASLADLVPSIVQFYGGDGLNEVRTLLGEVGSRA